MLESMAQKLAEVPPELTEIDDFKFNLLALNRREPLLMSCMVARPGTVIFSSDLGAGEPSCTAHFSQDPNYFDACFGMVGKEPYYKDGVLKIDDIYLSVMSVSPIGRDRMAEVFANGVDGVPFVEQWMRDPEVIKKHLKRERQIHKILALGLAYGLSSPKSMVNHALKAGYVLSPKDAKEFKNAYWELFKGVKNFDNKLINMWRRDGYIVNPFGYRCLPDAEYKVMNAFIQSTVSGLMNLLCLKFFSACPWGKFICILHDELLCEIPEGREAEAKKIMDAAVVSLNQDLKWTVDIRVGWVTGKNLYESK